MQKRKKRSFRRKINIPRRKTPGQRFQLQLSKREKIRAKSREKITRIKMRSKAKIVKQRGKQKEKTAGRVDGILSSMVFMLGAGIMVLDGLLESRR